MSYSRTTPKTALSDRRISLRFKPAEWSVIESDIEASGLSVSDYFRKLALESPVPRKVRRKDLGEHAVVYARWLGELGKIGSNLNQLTRRLNTFVRTGDPVMRPSNKELLETVEAVNALLQTAAAEVRDIVHAKKP